MTSSAHYVSDIQFNIIFVFISDDHSRVVLNNVENLESSDYINANYIDVCIFVPSSIQITTNHQYSFQQINYYATRHRRNLVFSF